MCIITYLQIHGSCVWDTQMTHNEGVIFMCNFTYDVQDLKNIFIENL